MKSTPESLALAAVTLTAFLVTGCVFVPTAPTTESEQSSNLTSLFDQLVSRDVVSVLKQVDRLSPTTTTLGTSDTSLQQGPFAEALKNEFESAGYAIRSIAAGPDTIPVSFQLDVSDVGQDSAAKQNYSQTVTVTVGDVAVRRTYMAYTDGQVVPVGRMQVRGVDARRLQLDNEIFSMPAATDELKTGPEKPPVALKPSEQMAKADTFLPAPASDPQPPLTSNVPQYGQTAAPSTIGASVNARRPFLDLVAPSVATARPQSLDTITTVPSSYTKNVRELQQSNFEALFTEMGIVSEKVLTFANDSTRMGVDNKARLQQLLKDFDPKRDVLSVVGCSLGPTQHSGGQEGLARGRAMRVREELLYAGVPDDQIMAEGCWAEETFDQRMPRRGVVVTLKRPVS